MVVCVAVEAGAGLVVAHSASVFVSCYLSDTTYRAWREAEWGPWEDTNNSISAPGPAPYNYCHVSQWTR